MGARSRSIAPSRSWKSTRFFSNPKEITICNRRYCSSVTSQGHFAKGFHANFSEELFKIIQVRISTDVDQPPRYEVEDYNGDRIAGGFYAQELLKAKYPKVFLVESILKTRIKNGVRENLTKWLGWPASFNTWEPEGNVISQ